MCPFGERIISWTTAIRVYTKGQTTAPLARLLARKRVNYNRNGANGTHQAKKQNF